MISSLDLRVANVGLRLDLRGFGHQICGLVQRKYRAFPNTGELSLACELAHTAREGKPEDVSVTHTSDHESHIRLPSLEGWVDWRRAKINAEVWGGALHPIENLLRTLVSETLIREQRGLLLHSSGILWGDKAYVFAGKSESGKTTLARKAKLERTLSDELVALTLDGDSITAHATPFYGEMGQGVLNASAPLAALSLFDGKDRKEARKLGQGEALQALLSTLLCYSSPNPQAIELAKRMTQIARPIALTTTREEPIEDIVGRIDDVVIDA